MEFGGVVVAIGAGVHVGRAFWKLLPGGGVPFTANYYDIVAFRD